MKNALLILILVVLGLIMLGVVFFPIIIAFWTGNLLLMFLYAVWWVPIVLSFMIIMGIAKGIVEIF